MKKNHTTPFIKTFKNKQLCIYPTKKTRVPKQDIVTEIDDALEKSDNVFDLPFEKDTKYHSYTIRNESYDDFEKTTVIKSGADKNNTSRMKCIDGDDITHTNSRYYTNPNLSNNANATSHNNQFTHNNQSVNVNDVDHTTTQMNIKAPENLTREIKIMERMQMEEDTAKYKSALQDIPEFITNLHNSYTTIYNLYTSTAEEFNKQSAILKTLNDRITHQSLIINTNNDKLNELNRQNTELIHKQNIFISYKNEVSKYIELFKANAESKANETNRILKENSELQGRITTMQLELDIKKRQLKDNEFIIDQLSSSKDRIVSEIQVLKENIRVIENSTHKENLTKKITQLYSLQLKIKAVYDKDLISMRYKVNEILDRMANLKEVTARERAAQQRNVLIMMHKLADKVRMLQGIIDQVSIRVGNLSAEDFKACMAEALNRQRVQYEIDKRAYEARITELTSKIEGSTDTEVWDIFK